MCNSKGTATATQAEMHKSKAPPTCVPFQILTVCDWNDALSSKNFYQTKYCTQDSVYTEITNITLGEAVLWRQTSSHSRLIFTKLYPHSCPATITITIISTAVHSCKGIWLYGDPYPRLWSASSIFSHLGLAQQETNKAAVVPEVYVSHAQQLVF